ncbi:hypothetical protein QSV08_06795 [Maribacter sp. BPC-D8]|uniref:hypothetical protein n=1 Tax=Maribacter sp. BPC-D8 TaxID=3053613 RepID=UPI002B49DE33|nr:hypothetical protein [Maribacter sp. BPC-D8]WRI30950.1 hypothetical protein QSV08_06795 [Maribacter sp. BPC-D8]
MKSKILVFILLIIATQSLLGQNKRQRKAAETFYKSQKLINNYTNSWYWLFGPSNSQENNDKYSIVHWELDDGGWYSGQGNNNDYNGYGIQHKLEENSYIFSNWKNTSPNGMTLSQSLDYSFIGIYENQEKNGFGITKWSNYKPFSNENYQNVIKYVGEYKDGIWSGYGIIYFRNGTYKSGIFIDSILSKELPKIEVLEALGF